MTSSSDLSVAQVQSALLETIEKDPDLRATLAAIAERIHEHPANAEKTPIQDWQEWLDNEGYDTAGLHQFIGTLLDSGLISNSIRGVKADASAGELISLMQRENPNLLDSILHSIDHSLQIHQELFGLAGGTARQPIAKALSIGQKKKEMATREAAAESAMSMSREASPLTDTTSVMGRDGAGQQKEYSRALDGVRTEVKASADARAEFRETDRGRGGTEIRRDQDLERKEAQDVQPMDGRGGTGEEREYARAIDAMRESLERRDTMAGPGGEQDRLSRVVDDLRQAIDRRRTIVGPGGEQDRLSRAVDAVREALDRRNTIVGPGGEQDDRLNRAVDELRDALNPNPAARAEFSETDPGMNGATEDPR